MRIKLGTPDLTEELVRFLRRMGYRAHEVDYGVVEVDADAAGGESQLDSYLRIWQQVHARADLELDPARAA